MPDRQITTILVGSEDKSRLCEIEVGDAPTLDYHRIAQLSRGQVQQWHSSSAGIRGPRIMRVGRSLLGNLHRAQRIVRGQSPGSVIYSTGETWGLPVSLAGMLQPRRNFTHVMYVHRVYSPTWLSFLHRTRALLAVDGYICVTRRQADLLRKTLGVGGPRVTTISQGVDTTFFDPARAANDPPASYLLAVGAEMRNYPLLFDAVRGLPLELVVRASSAWMSSARQELANIPPNVRIISERLTYARLRDLYAEASMVVTPLLNTPQAAGITTILEAMAMRKCVVATQSAGLPDALIHMQTGLIAPSTAAGLGQALSRVWNDHALRCSLAFAGQQLVREKYTLEAHAAAVADFLLLIANERNAGRVTHARLSN